MFIMKEVLGLVLCLGLANSLTYNLNSTNVLATVSDKFVSAALDATNLTTINLDHPHLVKLVSHLTPAYLRFGGTQADAQVFQDNSSSIEASDKILTSSRWLKLYEFASQAGVRVVFDLNSLLRNDDGSWNSTNAEAMLEFSRNNSMDLDWELGNEPDLYRAIYNTYVAADQLGRDYETLRGLMDSYGYNESYLLGPSMFDVGSNQYNEDYLKNFLAVASGAIHGVTWHQYYFAGSSATEEEFLNPATFNYLEQRINVVNNIVKTSNKVWLGETSSAYQGGAPGKSDRFLASFLWLDKLGLGAKLGIEVIIRQSIFGYNYPLLDLDYNPNPDWWVSVIYKKLVGNTVLDLTNDGADNSTVRLYAHCAKDGGVVVFGLNVASSNQSFSLSGISSSDVRIYSLTSDSLYSKTVSLNGNVLSLTEDLELPAINATATEAFSSYTLPAYSLAFLVFSNETVEACT